MVYFNNINGDEPIITGKKAVNINAQTPQKVTVVPVGQKSQDDTPQDVDKLPQGYYVEKTGGDTPPTQEPVSIPTEAPNTETTETPDETQNASTPSEEEETPLSEQTDATSQDDDDKPDTSMHTDERIELSESIITASDESRPVQEALNNAIRRSQNIMYGKVHPGDNDNVDYISSAESMIKHDTFTPMDMDYKKGLHVSGLGRFEINHYNYDVQETGSNTEWNSNAERIDLSGTYESKSGNTKLFGYLKGLTSQNNIVYKTAESQENDSSTEDGNATPETSDDVAPISDVMNVKSNYNEFCAYMGIKQKFNNGHALTATGFYDVDESRLTHTTEIDALYDLGFADVTGSAAIYKMGNTKATVKTNLSCKLKTFDKPADEQTTTEQTQEEQTVQSSEEEQTQQTAKSNGKKWDKKGGVILEFESEDNPEQGIGYYLDYRKNNQNSKTKFVVFGKASTTQRGEDEASSYHLTTGANLQYREKISSKYLFDLNLDVKDKVTVGGDDKGNITTAFGTARLTSKKLIAELEGKLILAKDTYKALALRLAYKFNPKLEVSLEGAAVNQNENGVKLTGYTALGSVRVAL